MADDATASFIKVRLCNNGEDSETPWAEDLGPTNGPTGSRKVRLVNVPFLHAKPTWGDVIIVSPVDDGLLTWDSRNVAWSKIDTRIEEDGGRFAMIVDYTPHDGGAGDTEFAALHAACTEQDVVCEGAWAPRANRPGRAYLAVPDEVPPSELMERFGRSSIRASLSQIHPKPGASNARGKPAAPAKARNGKRPAPAKSAKANTVRSASKARGSTGKGAKTTAAKRAAPAKGAAKRAAPAKPAKPSAANRAAPAKRAKAAKASRSKNAAKRKR